MKAVYKVLLHPIGKDIFANSGAPLRDLLFEHGVEFPCGGNGRCRGCRVRVVKGDLPLNPTQRDLLTAEEIENGWRLACQSAVMTNLTIELRQWDASILADESNFQFTPREGLGVAIDVGTTTLVAQLLDRETGRVLGVKTALNPQARFGADVMSRIQFAVAENGQRQLMAAIRHEVDRLIRLLLDAAGAERTVIRSVVLVGNTVMHHLFCGISVEPLSHYPFEPVDDGLQTLTPEEVGWHVSPRAEIKFLPCLGGFVGSDTLAGIFAMGLDCADRLTALIDLGTNGEIVVGRRGNLLCASTAAGPAFEGARISMGMRAATGSIWKVARQGSDLHCEVLGNVAPRGVCGSGLVDAVAVGLDLERILPTGRLANGNGEWMLSPPVAISQTDIRQLQLAKGAIAAGFCILLGQWGATPAEVERVHLAGAFGNYIDRLSARRIGLLPLPPERIHPAGNAALLGAKMALFLPSEDLAFTTLRAQVKHFSLHTDPGFQDTYVDEMSFPIIGND